MKGHFTKIPPLILGLMLVGHALLAQFTASGKVVDESGEPLIGVSISAQGTALGTITNVDGEYTLELPGNAATLEFTYVGYATVEQEVTSGSGSLEIVMEAGTTHLDEVVVTGLATSVKRANLANSVASISSAELTGIAVPTTTDAALYGKFKGVNISANSGAPGGGISFKLRGTTSINGSSQPIFVVDGIIIDNSSIPAGLNIVSRAAGGGATSNQDNPSNRLADIDPNDIEKIEVLKGASAAAIYGSRASGGVVIITTKRGQAGRTKIRLSQSVGMNQMLNPLGVRQFTEERILSSRFAGDIDLFRAAQNSGQLHDYEDALFGNNGALFNTRLSVSGGNERTQFYIGGTFKDEEGIVENTGYEKEAVRINLNHTFSNWLDAALTTNYIHSSSDRGFFNNDNSATTMGVAFTATPSFAQLFPDENGNFPANPYAASNFLETGALVTNNEKVNRFLGGTTVNAKLLTRGSTSLRLVLSGGVDYYNLATTALFPNSLQFQRDGNGLNGVSVQGSTNNLVTNLAGFVVFSHFFPNGLSTRTQVGVAQFNFDQNTILGESSNLIGSQTNLDQAGTRNVTQQRLIQEDKGVFIQEELNFKDQVIVTAGVRGDKSSNNGDPNEIFYYPKASLALNLHEFDLFSGDALSQLKLRVAYGQSGNFAKFGSKFTSFESSVVGGNPGIEIDELLGNSEVAPERQKELEFGADLGFLSNRLLVDITYYIKSVEDLLLEAQVPTSSGFQERVTNAAELENKGVELGVDFEVVRSRDWNWNTRLSWWKNDAEVTRLDVPSYTTGGFADFLGQYRIKQGHSPTEIIGFGPDADEDGLVVFGDAEPDFQMSWFNTLSWKRFDLAFLWHWKQGGEGINLSSLLFDLGETTYDYDDFGLDPEGALPNGPYRLSQLGVNSGPYIQDAGYIRLREIGLYYTLPRSMFNDVVQLKFGFSGTNILNFFDYDSYDPEVSNFGSEGLSTQVEVNPYPSAKRFDFHVIAEF